MVMTGQEMQTDPVRETLSVPTPARGRKPALADEAGGAAAFIATMQAMTPAPPPLQDRAGLVEQPRAPDIAEATLESGTESAGPETSTPVPASVDGLPWSFIVVQTASPALPIAKPLLPDAQIDEAAMPPLALENSAPIAVATDQAPARTPNVPQLNDPSVLSGIVIEPAETGDGPFIAENGKIVAPNVPPNLVTASGPVQASAMTTAFVPPQTGVPIPMQTLPRSGGKPVEAATADIDPDWTVDVPEQVSATSGPTGGPASPLAPDTLPGGALAVAHGLDVLSASEFDIGLGASGADRDHTARLSGGPLSGGAPLSPGETARQIVPQIAAVLSSGKQGTTEIALNPEELGKVRIQLSGVDQTMTVAIIAERPETADLMRRHIDTLVQDFRALGYTDVRFDFGQQAGRGSDHGTGQDTRGQTAGPGGTPSSRDNEAEQRDIRDAALVAHRTSRRDAGSGLDLRL